jgi:hypothetical protein
MPADLLQGQVGRGWTLEIETFLGPVTWHRAVKRVQLGPQKKLRSPGPNTFLLAQVMDLPASKPLQHGRINQRSI